jgi:formate dehydrogenase subunit gamma
MAEPRIQRFNRTQRALHWSHSLTFLALLATGIILLVPQIGERVGNHLTVLQIHEYIAIFYITGPLLWLILGDRRSLIKDVHTFDTWDEDDISWLKQSLVEGPAAKDLPPQGRFNAGQKLNGILTLAATVGFIVTGLILWKPTWLTSWAPSWLFSDTISNNAIFLHQVLTYVSIPLVLGHIYLAAVARATRPALPTIWDGTVPVSYARAHHPKWAAEVLGPAEAQTQPDAQGQDTSQPVGMRTH